MKTRYLRWMSVPLAFVMAITAVGSVLADTPISEEGQVGQHRLVDTVESPGARCDYSQVQSQTFTYEAVLNRIHVRPPRMKAFAGRQTVGWRFVIYSRWRAGSTIGDWELLYRSARQLATATVTRNAKFTWMSQAINVPEDGEAGVIAYDYLVEVRMLWLDNDWSVSGRSVHEVDSYRGHLDGSPGGPGGTVFGNDCQGWVGTNP